MNHTETGESAVIVQTAKEACAQGLIVGGGGKEGIFIKEVKPESPASKHLSVKEGDQILSATVYFDNVSYEDALQILEHAQPYKMELRLKRKNVLDVSTTEVGTARPEVAIGEEGDSPVLRGRKSKRQDARISWPKFPSFSMGRKAQFKRSHSTSEAEDKRKLEMSPTTSDTESPIKSPGGKDKKKKMKLKGKKKGLRSKSVEQTTEVEEEAATENQDQAETELAQYATDLIAIDDAVRLSEEARQMIKEDEFQDSELNKAIKEQTFPSSTGSDIDTGIHKVELITLDRNLKTTDITEALAISSTSFKTTPEITAKKERSELKVKIQGKDLLEGNIESQAKYSPAALKKQGTPSYDSIMFSSKMSQEDTQGLDANIISQITNQDMEMHLPKVDASVDVVDMELLKKSQTSGTNKQWKERTTVFPETEIYGIRTRGPLADIATSKAHFAATANGFQFSETDLTSSLPKPVISQPKTNTLEMTVAGSGPGGTETELASKFPVQTRIDDVLEKIGIGEEPRFKLPKIDLSELPHTEVIKMTEVENIKAQFPKREELEIPGMEDGTSKINVQKQVVKLPQMDVSKDIHSVSEIQAQKTDDEFNLEDVKTAVAKMQSFKVPRIDMSGIHVHTGVTKTEVIDKITAGAPSRPPSQMKEEINVEGKVVIVSGLDSEMQDTTPTVKLPKIELPYIDHEQLSVTEIDYSKPRSKTLPDEFQGQVDKMNYKLPNRDEIEIPGMEAIEKTHIQMQKMTTKSVLPLSETKESNEQAQCRTSQMDELIKKEVISEKKSKKDKMSSFGITKPDIRFPDSGIDLIKQDAFLQDTVVDSLDSLGTKKDLTDGGEKPEVGITLSVTQTAPLHEEADMNTKDSVIKMSPSKIKLPKLKLPKIGVGSETKMSTEKEAISAADVSIVSQTASVEVKTAAPNVEAKVPDLSKFKLPKFEISLPMVKLPDISMQVSGRQVKEVKEPQLDVQAPDDMPDVERIKSPKVAIEYASFDKPDLDDKATDGSKFKLPKFGISMPKVKVPDISMQTAKVKVKASLPEAKSDVYTGDLNTMDIPVKATAEISEVDTKEMKQPKISFPKFGFLKPDIKDPGIDITIPTAELTGLPTVVVSPKDTNITIPTVEASLPEGKVKTPNVEIGSALLEMNVVAPDGEIKLSNFGISESKVKAPDISLQALSPHVDVSQSKADVKPTDISKQEVPLEEAKFGFSKPEDNNTLKTGVPVPELKAENKDLELDVQAPKSVDIRIPETNIVTPEVDTKISDGSKFKLPTFGIPIPKLKGPDKSLPVSRSQVTVSIPEAEASVKPVALDVKEVPVKAAVEVSEVEVKEMKKPMISIPTIGLPKFYMKSPEIDVTLPKSDSDQPELHAEIKEKGLDVQAPKEQDIIVPGTEVSISGGKIKPPYVETEGALLETDIVTPDLDSKFTDGSKFKLPKFGISMPKVKGPDIRLQTSKPQVDISMPEMNADVQTADLVVKEVSEKAQVEMSEVEGKEIKKPKFSFPKFGFSKSDIKAPEIDVTLPKADIAVPQLHPEVKEPDLNVHATKSADITIPAIDVSISGGKIKPPTTDTQGASLEVNAEAPDVDTKGLDGSKFKLPKFGISMPKVKEPDISLQTSKPQVDISLPEMNADVQPADLDVKEVAEKAQVEMPEMEGKEIKKPKFSFPKFGFSKSDIKAPEIDVTLPKADITVPQLHLEVKEPDLNVHATKSADITIPAIDVSISGGKIKPPTIDTQGASLEVNAEAPDVDTKGLDGSKFKLPKFGISMPKVKGPDISLQTSKPQVDISLQDTKADVQPKDLDVKEVIERVQTEMPEAGGKEIKKAKFSFPKFGFSKPDIKGPEIDVTLPKADITAPEFHSEVKEPELNVQRPKGVDMTIPAIDVSISDRKIKPPTAKIGISMEKVKGPDINLQASGPQVDISLPEAKADGQPADLDVKEVADVNVEMPEMQGKGMKERMFSFPKFGFSRSEMKGPEIDVPLPKTDSALPEIHPEIKEHGLNAQLPKCGDITIPEIDVLISDGKMEPPTTEIQSASLEVMADASDVDTKDLDGSKFKLPKFGISMPKMKGPDISLQTSGPQEDISLPEIKADIQPTDLDAKEIVDKAQVEIPKAEGKEMKRSKFSFPKFSFSKPDIKAPEIDVTLPKADIAAPKFHPVQLPKGADITIPAIDESISDGKIKPPNVKTESTPLKVNAEALDVDAKGLEGSKFKLPKFGISMPKVKGPDISLQASGPEVDISLPEAKADDQPADLDVKEIAGKAQVEMPEVNGTEMKFGLSWSDIKGPEIDVPLPKSDMAEVEGTELNVHATKGADITIPAIDVSISQGKIKPPTDEIQGASLEMNAEAPDVDIKGLDGSRFKLPKFGISMPKVKGPDIRLQASGPQVDTSLPEAKTNVQATDLNVKDFPGKAVVSIPEVEGKEIKKPKFSFPRFGFSKPDIRTPEIDVTLPKAGDVLHPEIRQSDVELDTKVRESNLNVQSPQKLDVTMPVTDASILEAKIKAPKVEESDADTKALDGSKFKLPKFGISVPKVKGPDISMQVSGSPQIDISDVKTDVQPLDTDIEQVSAEAAVELPDVKETKGSIKDKVVAGSLTKFKLPSFSLPKFGGPADMSIKGDGTEILSAEISSNTEGTGVTSDVTDVKDPLSKSTDVDAKAKSAETEQQESKFSLPKFSISLPKVQVSETRQIDSEAEAPKSGFSKGDIKTSEVKMSSTETKSEKDEAAQDVSEAPPELKDTSIFGSPTRFKLPSFKLPKIGISSPKRQAEIEVGAKVTEISMTDTELKVSSVIPSSEGQESSEVPETQKEIDEVVLKGQEDLPDSKDGQIKTKKSSFSFPKFGFTKPEVQVPKVNLPEVDTSLPEGSMEVTEPADGTRGDKEDKDANITGSPTKFKIPTIKFPKFGVTAQKITGEDHNEPTETKELNVKIQDTDSNVSGHKIEVTTHEVGLNSDVSVPEDSVQVKMTEPGVKSPEDKTEVIKTVVSPSKFKLAFKLPTFGVSPAKEPADIPKVDAKDIEADNDQKVLGEVASTDIKVVKEQPMDGDFITTGQLDGQKLKEKEDDALKQASAGAKESEPKVTLGSPSKFKLPTFKLPRFGAKTKTETDIKTDVSEPEVKSSSTVSQAELPNIPESEVMDSGLEKIAEDHKTEVKKPAGVESSPSKFKLPTFKMSKFGVSKSKPEILEVSVTSDNSLETAHKDETKTPEKFSLSTIGGVLRGFDVEFNVPKMEESSKEESTEQVAQEKEVESAMTISEKQNNADVAEKFPKLGVSQTPEDTKTSGVTGGDSLKQTVAQEGQKVKFPEFPQTKSATCVDSESTKQKADLEDHSASENIADDTSLTFSVRSSDAFADVSSAQTTEHVSTLPQSPTRVTVKFSESSNTGGAADIQGELITSTARSELISMEPHLPEKINIPYSSDVSSSSVDTLKQEPGAVHIITSNVQAQPDTEQITVLTHFGEQGVQHFPIQQVTIQTASGPWSLEQTSRVQDGWDIRVEKHMVKEMSGEDKEKVIITQRTHVFEVDTSEPKTGDAASSIQRLRDTVHTEKIRFFESQGIPSKLSAESTETTDKDVPFHSLKEHQDE